MLDIKSINTATNAFMFFLLGRYSYNAENKRRPDRAVRWRPKAGTNLIDLLSGWTFTTQSIGRHGAQFTWSREGFFERESLGGRAMLSQGVQLLRRFFD